MKKKDEIIKTVEEEVTKELEPGELNGVAGGLIIDDIPTPCPNPVTDADVEGEGGDRASDADEGIGDLGGIGGYGNRGKH